MVDAGVQRAGRADEGDPRLLSVVVIGRNEGERLRGCLASVRGMEGSGFAVETIYVDSGSTDGSVAMAKAMGVTTIALRPERPSAALGRNAGWRAATGEIVLFLDGDTILHREFVRESLGEFRAAAVAAVWGHRREIDPGQSVYTRVLDLDWIFPAGPTLYCGGDVLFRRSALVATGGFDETLIAGEEPDLCRRAGALGYVILHVDRPMTGHDLAIRRWGQYWKRSARAGHAYAEVSERFRTAAQPFWLEESRRNQRRAWVLLGVAAGGAVLTAVLRSVWPAAAALGFFGVLAARSAWKARWKCRNWATLALYGVHSHLQQIPIYVGQLQFWWNRRRGQRARLVEYKQPQR